MRTILSILTISFMIHCYSQPDDITWQQCFGTSGPNLDWPKCIESTSNGYIIGINISNNDPHVSNFHDKGEAMMGIGLLRLLLLMSRRCIYLVELPLMMGIFRAIDMEECG